MWMYGGWWDGEMVIWWNGLKWNQIPKYFVRPGCCWWLPLRQDGIIMIKEQSKWWWRWWLWWQIYQDDDNGESGKYDFVWTITMVVTKTIRLLIIRWSVASQFTSMFTSRPAWWWVRDTKVTSDDGDGDLVMIMVMMVVVMMVMMVSEGHQSHQWWWLRSLKVQSITMITMLMMMMGITVHDLKNKRLEWSYFKIVNYDGDLCWTYLNRPPQACTCAMCITSHHMYIHRHVWEHSECSWGKVGGLL